MYTLTTKGLLVTGMTIIMLVGFTVQTMNVWAHGESFSIEKEVDGYIIDIGQTPENITANESVRFAYDLLDNMTNEVVTYTDVWVRIQKDRKVIFASGIHQPKFGSTGMTFTFPESGEYELSVRFQNEGDSIVETSIPLTVVDNPEGGGKSSPWLPLGTGVVGCILGFALAFMFRKSV